MGFRDFFISKKNKSLDQALYVTKNSVFAKIGNFLRGKKELSAKQIEELEAFLIGADVGVDASFFLLDELQKRYQEGDALQVLRTIMQEIFQANFDYTQNTPLLKLGENPVSKPYVIVLVGINGVGKTTSIAKLAHMYQSQGLSVLLGAGDTFRAAAVDQLDAWATRLQLDIVKKPMNSDPSAVAYETISRGLALQKDVILLDTAGRLHTKEHLMRELGKIERTIKKQLPESPQETLLVVDGSTGQNALRQVEVFRESVGVSGLIISKLDGSSKGGFLVNLAHKFPIPTRFIGVGESLEDWLLFDPKHYLDLLFAV